jgi:hypothetical protein
MTESVAPSSFQTKLVNAIEQANVAYHKTIELKAAELLAVFLAKSQEQIESELLAHVSECVRQRRCTAASVLIAIDLASADFLVIRNDLIDVMQKTIVERLTSFGILTPTSRESSYASAFKSVVNWCVSLSNYGFSFNLVWRCM